MSVYVHLNAHKFGRGFASGLLNCSKRTAQPLGSDFCTAYFPGTLHATPLHPTPLHSTSLQSKSKSESMLMSGSKGLAFGRLLA